jgi:inorganic phosphate transporter, PiT family
MTITLLILVILVALVFAYTNGFHDSANAIATVVSTKALSPRVAIAYGASFNFIGAFFGIQVAKTIGVGIVAIGGISQGVILCALLGAIIWNLLTWYYGLPSSSSHALIGGLIGAAIAHESLKVVNWHGVVFKVLVPMVASPFIGLIASVIIMAIIMRVFHRITPHHANKRFRQLQLISSGLMALSHGSNDTQKIMGIIAIAWLSFFASPVFTVPLWVIIVSALTMAFGTMSGGIRIIRTMGNKVIKITPAHGFAAQTSAAGIILTASHFGVPLSTTHVISGAIIGAGSTKRLSAINWRILNNIIFAWFLTIPTCMLIAGGLYYLAAHLIRLIA